MSDADYSDFKVMPVVLKGIAADSPGPSPRESYGPGERQRFEAIRGHVDRALQATGENVYQPQIGHKSPEAYTKAVLGVLAKHTEQHKRLATWSIPDRSLAEYTQKIVGDALDSPRREGRLAEIVIVDRSGREVREFVGSKKSWMQHFEGPTMLGTIYINGQPQRV
ncbi:hypothetical protein [Paraburkholderia sp. D1E]|uniref:hypothetical protein n=1 Tax=Paraburkholderia sp. D1E TaxID=3461398 RepID=UPI004046806E